MIDITEPGSWRLRIWVRVLLYFVLGVLALLGVLVLPTWETALLVVASALLFGAYLNGVLDAERWMGILNPALDLGLLHLLVAHGDPAGPWDGLAYVWLAGISLTNFRRGRTRALPLFAALTWLVLVLSMLGEPGWWQFAVGHALGLGLLTAVVTGFLRERKDGRADPLTGALQRRAGLEELRMMTRRETTFNLAFVDMRGFKRINDAFGHSVGDEVLAAIATRLVHGLRKSDVVIRYGGDEFIVASSLDNLGERIGVMLRDPIRTSAGLVSARADIGVIAWHPGVELRDLLAQADRRMYERKRTVETRHL